MKKNIYIIGSGNHAKVIFFEILKINKFKILGFIDDFKKKGELIIKHKNKKYYNLGTINYLKKLNKPNSIVAIGNNLIRSKIVKKIDNKFEINWVSINSPNSIIASDVKIGKGSMILPGVVINNNSIIGDHCIINTSSSIDHDNFFDNFSSTGPNVATGGNVKVGACSHLGIGSSVKENINIKKNTMIGGGSFINKNCLANSTYFGVPAKKIK